ncbi:transcriptional regulator of the spore photoproduct lyase operon [Pseudogracilibacillus auburnensis]|uniref:Transcriptional regulator of the spore photoproduct lyase operon n=2 Tax=Pseudogracilibacillus auburnensis TaxID=1494959 RepID=A0A2V3W1H4_9BACI|nr:transcriptional regulator of the spore photoproduct lyase operon [Pseudogracilibacillus auburnensis]
MIEMNYQAGEIVYVIIRNPHAQDVAQVQQAAVVQHPENPNELALFSHENYYPFSEEFAVFKSEEEAEQAYEDAFGSTEIEGYNG